MRIMIYVDRKAGQSPQQSEWAQRRRAEHHKVNFALDDENKFKVATCDAFISDKQHIKDAYAAIGVPEFDNAMLDNDIEQRTPVQAPKRRGRPPKQDKQKEAEEAVQEQAGQAKSAVEQSGTQAEAAQ